MLSLRPYEAADLESLVNLINKADDVDDAGQRTTAEALRHALAGGLGQRTFLARHHDRLVGYIQLALDQAPGTRTYYGYGATDPDCRRRGVGTALFRYALEYLDLTARSTQDHIRFNQFARLWIPGIEALVQRSGLAPGKTLLSMRRPHMAQLLEPVLPPGYRLRPVAAPDAAACAEVYNSAYAWRGNGTVRTSEEMEEELTAPGFRPDLFPVAVRPDGRVVGYGHATLHRDAGGGIKAGRLHTLVVLQTEQGTGLGRALLWASLAALKQAGAPAATLSVEADNPTPAVTMYERAGFERWRQSVLYSKAIQ